MLKSNTIVREIWESLHARTTEFVIGEDLVILNFFAGSIGLLAVVAGTPLLFVLDACDIEKLHPLPDGEQIRSVVLSAVFGQ